MLLYVVIVIIIIYVVVHFFYKDSTTLVTMQPGSEKRVISASSLANSVSTSNFTYSLWINVDDWNYRFGEEKVLISRKDGLKNPAPKISLGAIENNLIVDLACYPNEKSKDAQQHRCEIKNIPLQTWTHILVSLYNRTLDMYLNGKLVRTCVLPGVAKIDPKADVTITPGGGFSGWSSNFHYWNRASNPQQAFNVYRDGFGGGRLFGGFFDRYRLRLSFISDNIEQGSVEI